MKEGREERRDGGVEGKKQKEGGSKEKKLKFC